MALPKNDLDNHSETGETNGRLIAGQEQCDYSNKDRGFWFEQHDGDHGDTHAGDGEDLGSGGVGHEDKNGDGDGT